ncbi:unnamed protein product [Sphagnum troendelagicum]|uniref:J domain-containing protein n=1 Tax=Sphagnum troendelagicum TaxID=128251 RepID=A0ABP0UYH3_9BRYO
MKGGPCSEPQQKNYYEVLRVGKNATDKDLRKAFRRLAMKWHPDKNPTDEAKARVKFNRICESFAVLMDPHTRAIVDIYGEEGLKKNIPNVASGTQGFSNGGATNMHRYQPRDAEEVFNEFFGGVNPFAGLGGDPNIWKHHCLTEEEIAMPVIMAGDTSPQKKKGPRKSGDLENKLLCTLEELFSGCIRKVKISRSVMDPGRKTLVPRQEILTIQVQPGWSKGTKITFPEMGNPQGKLMPADLVFIIDERPHDTFKREGDNLVTVQKISLTDALIGHTVTLKTCDGRILNIPCSDVIHPGYEKVIQNEGMPILKEPGKKGNLHIKFDLKFPKHLTPDQKTSIKKILG